MYHVVYVAHEDDTHERRLRRCIYNVPVKIWWRLRFLSVEQGTTVSKLVIQAIEWYLDRGRSK